MNKAERVSHVAAETFMTRAAARRMVGPVLSVIANALVRHEPVTVAGFAKFAIRGRAARHGRDPRTGESVAIPAPKVPSFKPAKAPRDAVNEWHDGAAGHVLAMRFGNAAAARACLRNAALQNLVPASRLRQTPFPSPASHRNPSTLGRSSSSTVA